MVDALILIMNRLVMLMKSNGFKTMLGICELYDYQL